MHCKELTVEKLTITNPRSKSKVEVTESRIVLHDDKGTARAALEIWGQWDAPRLTMYDQTGQERLNIGLEGAGSPFLTLKDANGVGRVNVQVFDGGWAAVTLYDAMSTTRMELSVDIEDGTPRLALSDRTEKDRVKLWIGPGGEPQLALYDAVGKEHLTSTPNGKEG